MLPRVNAALTKFLNPITSSARAEVSRVQTKPQEFQRFKEEPEKKEGSRQPQMHEKRSSHLSPEESAQEARPSSEGTDPTVDATSATQTFLSLLNRIQKHPAAVLTWLGSRSYQKNQRNQKKGGKSKKGTILDEQAE